MQFSDCNPPQLPQQTQFKKWSDNAPKQKKKNNQPTNQPTT